MQQILLRIDGEVATITLNRPAKGNSLTATMGAELQETMKTLEEKMPKVRVVVLTGAGKYFCTGLDLSSVNEKGSSPSSSSMQFFECLRSSKLPVIVKLNGPVMAGGTGSLLSVNSAISLNRLQDCCLLVTSELQKEILLWFFLKLREELFLLSFPLLLYLNWVSLEPNSV